MLYIYISHEQLKLARTILGLTQKEIANLVNLTTASYAAIEMGKSDPKVSTLKKICKYFEQENITFHQDGNVTLRKQ